MERLKRLFYLTLFNVLVSATTTLAVLYAWDLRKDELAKIQLSQPSTTAVPAVTIVVVNAASEGTSVVQTLGIPTEAPGASTPLPPTPPSQVYRVREGDTLGIIAERFDIAMAEILAINDLPDPNNLYVGQAIFIPTGPLPTLTPSYTPTVTATPTSSPTPRQTRPPSATPSPTLGTQEVVIETILGVGDLANEKVRIMLRGGQDVSLAGWQISDSDGFVYTFPQLDLFAGGAVLLNTRSGLDTPNDLYWGMSAPVWQPGETALLRDAQGNQQAIYQVP